MDKQQFEDKVRQLADKGYIPFDIKVADVQNNATASAMTKNIDFTHAITDDKQDYSFPVYGGTDNLGYIPWGKSFNDLPHTVAALTDSMPYTSQGIRYLIDLTVGLGPEMMYSRHIVQNGNVRKILLPYEDAGEYILSLIQERQNNNLPTDNLKEEYRVWQQTNAEYSEFKKNNNIEDVYLKVVSDHTYFDICFPTVGLSTERRVKDAEGKYLPWNPKIVRIGCLPAICTRLEEMDSNIRINYVYYSEIWRNKPSYMPAKNEVVAYPTLMQHNFITKLRAMVKSDAYASYSKRNSWYCAPIILPSVSKFYYPVPAWWSVFTSHVYQYADTLISDKATARQNSTMWGKMIFINNVYLQAVFASRGADTEEEKQNIRLEIWTKINDFLKRKENNGKTIALDSILSPDGKSMMNAVEIIDVPQPSSAGSLTEELEEITSIIFFAMGIHPGLIGAIPGKTKSNSGTYQRELTLLKQNQLSSRQRQFLRFFQNINTFNNWDPHAKWVIKQQVLTTLDRSPQGVTDTVSE